MKYAPDTIILKTRSGQGQGHSDLKMVRNTLPSQDASTHQIWNSYLKEYRRYGPDTKAGLTDGRTDFSAITICLPKFLWGHKNWKIKSDLPVSRYLIKILFIQLPRDYGPSPSPSHFGFFQLFHASQIIISYTALKAEADHMTRSQVYSHTTTKSCLLRVYSVCL